VKCQYCGKDETLPFKCQYCQGLFCSEHRLPENHSCPMAEQARAPKEEPPPFEYKVSYTPPRAKSGFSTTEIRDLAISALLVSAVGLSLLGVGLLDAQPELVAVLVLLFTSTFLIHEIAHKITAQHYGLWAEFRLTLIGALITLVSIVSPFFKIISPGAVMIAGNADKETIGKTSIAGPLTNIVFCMVAFAFTFILPEDLVVVAVFTAFFNALIAVLNLIPIGILDGWKVFQWSKIIWALAFASSVILIFALLSQPQNQNLLGL
jgi:Zn-dependent protease